MLSGLEKLKETMRLSFEKAAEILRDIESPEYQETIDSILYNKPALAIRISDLINAHSARGGVEQGYRHRLSVLKGFNSQDRTSVASVKAINEAKLAMHDYNTLAQHLRARRPK